MKEWTEERLEELLPVVAKLAGRYTRGMSTSVTYEKAQEFMEAVLYCIREYEQEQALGYRLMAAKVLSTEEIYELGYELVVKKVKKMRLFYNTICGRFRSYGCRNYEDIVQKGLPEFFLRYDPRFAPQKNILMFDYPILQPAGGLRGIDAVEHYLSGISLEQRFLNNFEERYVCRVLTAYDWNYQEQFYNLGGIFLRHVMGCILAEKRPGDILQERHIRTLEHRVSGRSPEELETVLCGCLRQMVERQFCDNELLYEYLSSDMKDLVVLLSQMTPGLLEKEFLFA